MLEENAHSQALLARNLSEQNDEFSRIIGLSEQDVKVISP